jgi:hypothetical protein
MFIFAFISKAFIVSIVNTILVASIDFCISIVWVSRVYISKVYISIVSIVCISYEAISIISSSISKRYNSSSD